MLEETAGGLFTEAAARKLLMNVLETHRRSILAKVKVGKRSKKKTDKEVRSIFRLFSKTGICSSQRRVRARLVMI